jgi:hypothetical protein
MGYLSPLWAAVIMAGSSLLVIANSMRLEYAGRNVAEAQPRPEAAAPLPGAPPAG